MFGFHFAIYGEMLTYGFLKKETRVRYPRYRLFGNASLRVDFSLRKINSVRPPNAVRVHSLNLRFFNLVFAKNEILKVSFLKFFCDTL